MIIFFVLNLLKSSTALTWTFPENYTKNTYWVFLFNLDVWEFAKVASGEYIAQVSCYCIVGDMLATQNSDRFFGVLEIL